MALFDDVFKATSIYEMLFFNVKSVLIYPTLKDLEENNKPMFERWKYLSKSKYNLEVNGYNFDEGGLPTKQELIYEENAPYYPEYSKIVAITHANLYNENGKLQREFKKIVNPEERIVVEAFMAELRLLSNAALKSNPQFFPPLCGHNIISHDIPLLIKRFIVLNPTIENDKKLPLILKRSLSIKPWESGLIDTVNVWKFNGYDNIPLMLIGDFLGLKKTVELLSLPELSKYYWDNIGNKPKETLEFVALQSATQTNLVIQLMNGLRQL